MSDINYRSYPYAGIIVPSETPFFPVITNGKLKFNQGYVFDYNSEFFGSSSEEGKIKIHKVEGMENEFDLAANKKYSVSIIVDAEDNEVTSAKFDEEDEEKDNEYNIKVCEFNGEKQIAKIYLRENIHWQKLPKPPSEETMDPPQEKPYKAPFFLGYDGVQVKWFASEVCSGSESSSES